ncbi:MAG: sulfatase-like hydrolase/transferase [Gemmatimonadetes bacterium]|nr:sulfatase-like hydrolase/transferase [Gemmatimonadota bacterium]MYD26329.1 sulfatase-like hydrolase/transferase [Gemmatimonadota bacterium]
MASSRPNVLCILTDDQGVWAAGCYGNGEIRTPHIDRIAETGVRFDRFFVATPVCSPSRATLLTGRIPSQHGVHDWIRGGNVGEDAASYLEGETAYTDVLAAHGWRCGLSGKWHLGNSTLPQHGFSHWFTHQFGGGPYNDAPMVRNGVPVTEPGYVTNVITDDALAFIDRHANQDDPFYLSVHYTAPHSPWTGHPQDIVDSYDDCPFDSCPQEPVHPWAGGLTRECMGDRESLKGYFAAVTAMDLDVGRLLDRLDHHGIREDTLVVFLSDNGFSLGHHGFWGKGNGTSPLNMYENSILVPALVSQPGRLPEGAVQQAMISAYDFMPTLLSYLELPVPWERNLPGRNYLDAWMCGAARPARAETSDAGPDDQAARGNATDTGRDHVVVFDEYGGTRMIRSESWKYVHRYPDGPNELYDLENDPDERANLADDAGYAGRRRSLRGELEGWFERYADPDRDGWSRQVSGAGQLRPVGGDWDDDSPAFEQLKS